LSPGLTIWDQLLPCQRWLRSNGAKNSGLYDHVL